MKETVEEKRSRALEIFSKLVDIYGKPRTELIYKSDYQLLVAVILSAQTTDKKVNEVTPGLFRRFPTIYDMAKATIEELEALIKEIGLFRTKARYIIACCKKIVREFGGNVPNRFEDLIALPGIGRKSANVLLANLFNQPAITVDTHVKRLSYRMGFTDHEDPVKIEFDLMELLPEAIWTDFSHCLIYHGRRRCKARKPYCGICEVSSLCLKRVL